MTKNSQVANQVSGTRKKSFFSGAISELKKVIWPTKEELINHEIVVIDFTFLAALSIWVFDFGFSSLISSLISLKQ